MRSKLRLAKGMQTQWCVFVKKPRNFRFFILSFFYLWVLRYCWSRRWSKNRIYMHISVFWMLQFYCLPLNHTFRSSRGFGPILLIYFLGIDAKMWNWGPAPKAISWTNFCFWSCPEQSPMIQLFQVIQEATSQLFYQNVYLHEWFFLQFQWFRIVNSK